MSVADAELACHLEDLGADNYMFSFRMLLVLFRRELPLTDVIMMWEVRAENGNSIKKGL